MYDLHEIVTRIKSAISSKGVIASAMLKEIGCGKNTLSNMETSAASCITLAKIADYLDCSTDYLLGRERNSFILNSVETELIDNFRRLSEIDKIKILERAKTIAEHSSTSDYSNDTEIKAARSSNNLGVSNNKLSKEQLGELYEVPNVTKGDDA
ncbi:MAG: hypothetical protein Q4E74_09300 [Ruminococcus sp.]|nr:hypothetical protein [Ruminococcus sp.]